MTDHNSLSVTVIMLPTLILFLSSIGFFTYTCGGWMSKKKMFGNGNPTQKKKKKYSSFFLVFFFSSLKNVPDEVCRICPISAIHPTGSSQKLLAGAKTSRLKTQMNIGQHPNPRPVDSRWVPWFTGRCVIRPIIARSK